MYLRLSQYRYSSISSTLCVNTKYRSISVGDAILLRYTTFSTRLLISWLFLSDDRSWKYSRAITILSPQMIRRKSLLYLLKRDFAPHLAFDETTACTELLASLFSRKNMLVILRNKVWNKSCRFVYRNLTLSHFSHCSSRNTYAI